jgi:hypothetical protein
VVAKLPRLLVLIRPECGRKFGKIGQEGGISVANVVPKAYTYYIGQDIALLRQST